MSEILRLQLYGDDGTTVVATYTTDPASLRPFIISAGSFAPQEIDFASGRAKIGSMRVSVLDVPTTSDQGTGHFTSLLAGASGFSARMGRRAALAIYAAGAYRNIIDGPIDDLVLRESFSGFDIGIKDQRENEKRTPAFTRCQTSAISPRGVIDGFGYNDVSGEWLAPPVTPHTATARTTTIDGKTLYYLDLPTVPREDGKWWPPIQQVLTPAMQAAMSAQQDFRFNLVRVLWRAVGAPTWNVVEHPKEFFAGWYPGVFKANGEQKDVRWLTVVTWAHESGMTALPADDTAIEFIIGYDGPASEPYPFHYEGPIGDLAAQLMDGIFSEDSQADVRYDAVAVAAMTERALLRITKPLDDEDGIWKWTEQNVYAAYGRAPALDADGLISPVAYALPPIDAVLVQLDDTNCRPIAGWSHTGTDALNHVTVEYPRFYRVPAENDPLGEKSAGDGLSFKYHKAVHADPDSVAFMGERKLTIKADTLGAIGGVDGQPANGDATDEQGHQMAELRKHEATDRFKFGGQHMAARVMRSSVGVLRAGQWVIGACTWWPAYENGTRGPSRLAQLMMVKVIDSQWYEVEAVDAGPDGVTAGQPTITAGAVDATGSATINVTVVVAGSEARVDYALNPTLPAADSPLWRFAGRVSAAGAVVIPPAPSNSTLWARARGEMAGKRPSAWTVPISIAIPVRPEILEFHVVATTGGQLKATWRANADTAGVRIYYESHDAGTAPSPVLYVDVDAGDLEYVFDEADTDAGEMFTVELVPYTGFGGGAVSGTAGKTVSLTVAGTAEGDESPMAPALSPGDDDEDQGAATAISKVIVEDPFGVATRLLNKKRIVGTRWPAAWTVKDLTPEHGDEHTETVALVEGHSVQVLWGLEYDIPGVTNPYVLPIFPYTSPAYDLGRIPNIVQLDAEFAEDGEVKVYATADFDTRNTGVDDSIIFTVGEDADPAAPTILAHDGAMQVRDGENVLSGVTVAVGANAHVLAAAISPDGVVGPVFGPRIKRRVGEVSGPGAGGITSFYAWRANTTLGDPVNIKATYAATGSAGWYVTLEEFDVYTETPRTITAIEEETDLEQSQVPFTTPNYLQAAKNAGDLTVDLIYTLTLYNDLDVAQASRTYTVVLTDVDEPL